MSAAQHVVVMGVSGTGKTTVAERLADRLGRVFVEGDSLHPPANVAKMSQGLPLDDEDRRPWLAALAGVLAEHDRAGTSTVLTCSSLRRAYRDVLRGGPADPASVFFVHLDAPAEVLARRMKEREHFMPASLLRSQLDTLEPLGEDEAGARVDVTVPVDEVVAAAAGALPSR